MRQLYRAASDRKLMIVGGDSVSVSLGGYITGGGHSTLSPWLGMAGDHIVELEVVTPDGNLVVANECLNPDLFWAARGVSLDSLILRLDYAKYKFRAAGLPSELPLH